jgi:hypothetical protein
VYTNFTCDRSRENANLPLNFDSLHTRQSIRKHSMWNREMVTLLRQLTSRLANTVNAWDIFQRKDISYFIFDGESQTTSTLLASTLSALDGCFLNLKEILRQLQTLQNELCQDSPQGV